MLTAALVAGLGTVGAFGAAGSAMHSAASAVHQFTFSHHGQGNGDDHQGKGEDHGGKPPHNPGDHQYGHHKVELCHKGHEIEVDIDAVPAHLAHGDTLGPCPPPPPPPPPPPHHHFPFPPFHFPPWFPFFLGWFFHQ